MTTITSASRVPALWLRPELGENSRRMLAALIAWPHWTGRGPVEHDLPLDEIMNRVFMAACQRNDRAYLQDAGYHSGVLEYRSGLSGIMDFLHDLVDGQGAAAVAELTDPAAKEALAAVFAVAAAEHGLIGTGDYLLLTAPWSGLPSLPDDPGELAEVEPDSHTPHDQVDVDADTIAAGGAELAPDYSLTPTAALWRLLGLQTDTVTSGGGWEPAPVSGPYARLAATLTSLRNRRDGNTTWSTSEPEDGTFRLRWWSSSGSWTPRRWWVQANVEVSTDDHLETRMWISGCTVAAVGRSNPRPTVYRGDELGPVLAGPVRDLLSRSYLRDLADLPGGVQDWWQAPPLGVWLQAPHLF